MKKIDINRRQKPKKLPNASVLNQHLDDGMTQKEIADKYDVTCSAICIKLRRAGYSPTRDYGGRPKNLSYTGHRVIKLAAPDVSAIMERYPAPSEVKSADRVTRITNGASITLKRVSFIDGSSA